jgi:hypothetical protein
MDFCVRLVATGYTQVLEVDFQESFAPMINILYCTDYDVEYKKKYCRHQNCVFARKPQRKNLHGDTQENAIKRE